MKRASASATKVLNRRRFIGQAGWLALATVAVGSLSRAEDTVTLPFENGGRPLVDYPQKRKLIRHTTRPPQLETPFSVFNEGLLTPNDAFFVRYHLAGIPQTIDPETFRLAVKGNVKEPLSFSLAELKNKFPKMETVAVNQCSGNSRGFFVPRVAGGQLGNGAMGNARWTGIRLKDLLNKCGVAAGSRQVTFNGMDNPADPRTPDYIKALDLEHAMDGEVMLAWAMNGEELPWLNGYPLRLVVPGYYGTYWIKHLNEITVLDTVFDGYWMKTAYRIPDNACACVEPGTVPKSTIPIARLNVRSFITSLEENTPVKVGAQISVSGIAFDGGYGLQQVSFSENGGNNWREATLGEDLGKYSFRRWTIPFTPKQAGKYQLKVKAANRIGQSQPMTPQWNPAGYMRNVVETVNIVAD